MNAIAAAGVAATAAVVTLAVVVGWRYLVATRATAGGDESTPPRSGRDDPDGRSPRPADGPSVDESAGGPTDEQVVLDLVEASDGPLPQSDVVGRTSWSKSKVSRVLARMDDEGEITKIDIGRGNVITLPGEEPPGAARPFEE